MIRAPRTIAIVKRIFMYPFTDEKRDRTTSLQSNSTRIVSRDFFEKVILLFPIINFPILREMETVLSIVWQGEKSNGFLMRHRKTFMCLVIFILTVVVDTCVNDLASLFGLCASMGLSVVSLILPSVMYLFGSRFGLHSVGAILVLFLGIVIMLGSTITIIMGMV